MCQNHLSTEGVPTVFACGFHSCVSASISCVANREVLLYPVNAATGSELFHALRAHWQQRVSLW